MRPGDHSTIHTLDHGLISAMHIDFADTMNALFLEGLVEKTRRGLEAAVKDAKSGGGRAYGYRAVHSEPGEEGKVRRGGLEIVEEEARIIRRIFEEYAAGRSPLHIAAALNADGVPAPRHKRKNGGSGHWKQNTINGHKQRGTGILNNELYAGRRVWNRLAYGKDPMSGRRVSRIRPNDERMTHDVPELRIVPEELWTAVKRRQDAQTPQRQAHWTGDVNRLSGNQALRRRKDLLSGLLDCGICGGKLTIAGHGKTKRYYCANHKEKGSSICRGMPGLRQTDAEALVLTGFRERLMRPEAYEKFRGEFLRHVAARSEELGADQKIRMAELAQLEARERNLVEAISLGQAPAALLAGLSEIEGKIAALRAKIEANRPRPVALPEDLPTLYQVHVANLMRTLGAEGVVGRAGDELRRMIDKLVVRWEPELGGHTIEIFGDLVAMLSGADMQNAAAYNAASGSLKMVAGAGFEPATFRL